MLKTKNQTTNDVFRGKNARNHVRVMFLEVQMRKLMLDLLFKSLNGNKKRMTQAVSSYTMSWKLGLMYLKAKLQEDKSR